MDAIAAVLKGNEATFTPEELALVGMLLKEGQGHMFASWPPPGDDDAGKQRLLQQLSQLDSSYPSGLCAYISNARQLLKNSKEGRNPFDGYTPSVPSGEKLDFCSGAFLDAEAAGLEQVGAAAFVLVAGGLGERLGYSGRLLRVPIGGWGKTCRCKLQHMCIVMWPLISLFPQASSLPYPARAPQAAASCSCTSNTSSPCSGAAGHLG